MNIPEILLILFIHWLSDFVFQTDKMAKNKSESNYYLFSHVFTYAMAWLVAGFIALPANMWEEICTFTCITLCLHFLQDYFTSRLNRKLYREGKNHFFFVSIGFDQFLHFAQLLITYKILFK